MGRRKVKDPREAYESTCKLLCDEAANHMKVRNYTRALSVYSQVYIQFSLLELIREIVKENDSNGLFRLVMND